MPTFDDFVNLSGAVYGDPPPDTVTIDVLGDPTGSHTWVLLLKSPPNSSGYFGAAYQDTVTNEIVLVNRGTNDLLDVVNDAEILLDIVPAQLGDAQNFYNQVKQEAITRGATISITGHSLGGSLTELLVASHATEEINGAGVFGQTFNALGAKGLLDNLGLPDTSYAVTNWVVPTDVVGHLAEHIGDTASLESLPFSFTYVAGPPGLLNFVYDSHSIDKVLDDFNSNNAHSLLQETKEFLIKTFVTDPGFPVTIDGEVEVGGNNRINVGNALNGTSQNDLLFGGLPDDLIHGGDGNDVIYAGRGNDTIWGDAGADIMLGEQGDDTYVVDDPGDRVIEVALEGSDTVESTVSYTLSANVENLFLIGNDAINATGNELNNVLIGNNAANVLDGGLGDDSLAGGGGNDILIGGAGLDTYSYATGDGQDTITDSDYSGIILYDARPADGGIRKATDPANAYHGGAQGSMTYVLDGSNLTINGLITVQNFHEGDLGIHLTQEPAPPQTLGPQPTEPTIDFSNGLPNRTELQFANVPFHFTDHGDNYTYILDFQSEANLVAHMLGGDDTINAGPGNDQVFGDDGNDRMFGYGGNDQLIGGADNDTLFGDTGEDFLQGDDGSDQLYGGRGNDVLLGGAGADQLWGDDPSIGLIEWTNYYWDGNEPPADLIGNDWLDGGDGNDDLEGAGGNDTLLGGDGNDMLIGDAVDAALVPQAVIGYPFSYAPAWDVSRDGNDWLDGGAGDDTLEGGHGDDTLLGGSDNDALVGDYSSNDYSESTDGNDYLDGGAGDDHLSGNGGNDTLLGGADNDTLDGGAGDDVFDGGAGNDVLIGGAGTNTILSGRGSGQDTVNDAGNSQATDIIQFAGDVLPGDVTVQADANLRLTLSINGTTDQVVLSDFFSASFSPVIQVAFADGTVWGAATLTAMDRTGTHGTERDDVITTGPEDNLIFAQGGNDTLTGGRGNDTLMGGAGNDTYVFSIGDGTDTIIDTAAAGEGNVVAFGNGITPGSLSLGLGSLLIRYGTEGDEIHIKNFDPGDALGLHAIDAFQFVDGTVLSYSDLIGRGFDLTGTSEDDAIAGTNVMDRISGLAGNDTLDGGAGDDTYIFNFGDGVDTIRDVSTTGEGNSIQFGAGVLPADLNFTRDRDNHTLTITYGSGGDAIQLEGFDPNKNDGSLVVSALHFTDGSSINMSDLFHQGATLTGTDGADVLVGTPGDDTIDGRGGNDQLDGSSGDDLLVGGTGDDTLLGGAGNDVLIGDGVAVGPDPGGGPPDPGGGPPDPGGGPPDPKGGPPIGESQGNDLLTGGAGDDLYVFNLGDGMDMIQDVAMSGEGNSIVFGEGISQTDLTFTQDQNAHTLTIAYGPGGDLVQLSGFDPNNGNGSLVVKTLAFADGSSVNMVDLYPSSENTAPTVANPIVDRSVREDARFAFVVPVNTFRDLDVNDTLTYSAGQEDGSELPSWLTFTAATRSFSGTPDDADIGTVSLKVTVMDGGGLSAASVFALTVTNVNEAPVVADAIADQTTAAGSALSLQVPANTFADQDIGDTLTYSASQEDGSALPGWLSFSATTRTFSGTPHNADAGTVSLKVTATDAGGLSATSAFALTVTNVNHAPAVANAIGDQNTLEDALFSFQVPTNTFTDQDANDTLTLSASLTNGDPLPAWVSFNATTATFSGTPDDAQVGTTSLKVTATDSGGLSAVSVFALTVTNVNEAPVVTHVLAAQSATEDAPFGFVMPVDVFADVDGGDTLTFSASLANGDPLPAWLAFDAQTGVFNGTPTNDAVGNIHVTVTATDSGDLSASDTFALTVINVNDAPTVANAIADQIAVEDALFSFQVPNDAFEDVDAGDALTFRALLSGGDALPGWLSFDAATRMFSGTPSVDDIGTVGIAVMATDSGGLSATDMFTLTVRIAPDQVVVGTDGDDVLKTSSGNDVINAGGGNDTVIAGRGNDTITGGAGNDLLIGGPGNDTYLYNLSDGLDQVADQDGTDTVLFGAGISFDTTAARLTTAAGLTTAHLRLLDSAGCELPDQRIDIPLDAGGISPIERFAFADGSVFELSDLVIQTQVTTGTNHDDIIQTGRADDVIYTLDGKDQVFAGSGNDTVYAGNGGDQVHGEGGNDVLYGGNGKDTLVGGAGNDTLLGLNGDDTLQGGGGDDALDSGNGADTILFGRGDGQDTLIGHGNNNGDTVLFSAGVNPVDLVLSRQASDLRVAIHGSDDRMTIQDWYADKANRVKEFKVDNGSLLQDQKVDQLIQAMAQFSADNGLTWDQAIDQRPQDVQTILAASWH